MKRSEINAAIDMAKNKLKEHNFHLPPFADWTAEKWEAIGSEHERVVKNSLGWDVSDYGSDDFRNFGTVFFNIRNGNHASPEQGVPYAEKVMILMPGQRLPLHFHWSKIEDIINRGGGILVMELYNALEDDSIDTSSPITVFCDGSQRIVEAGKPFELMPGESITIYPGLYHRFWASADAGVLVCGEVSSVNDDNTDNYFGEPASRFTVIDEDEPRRYVLCNEYSR